MQQEWLAGMADCFFRKLYENLTISRRENLASLPVDCKRKNRPGNERLRNRGIFAVEARCH
ncbi:MAG: hypothetical protein A2521_07820 [Deltaproteobacteria bacterium RIFOXYD12_FULL_57_12]|nr:MAG: hypothetical protein A2521_07820 [Deltaproteobacteria bacterium RIFOXYD12_FULL_57_12]